MRPTVTVDLPTPACIPPTTITLQPPISVSIRPFELASYRSAI